ncbi:MAG: hypothetical protein A2289_25475 [Deltaproteobacteria bacterium RIFOXYA12_FULL_58_15]|nr:MAG: hypothetical protein A2289_25475 [Deltaproteobacteria bacterium RIFOXYA12_FULL_58_15]OGR09045.1 MAG: hypothetical protein A2341_25960 [Deltaproteobacteria bacterium RIFOXYB12_FULL_58_9]
MLLALPAWAQVTETDAIPEGITEDKVLGDKKDEVKDGWKHKLSVGATGSFNHSSSVVGTVDGSSVQLGLMVTGNADLILSNHTWENSLTFKETQSRTPQVDSFLKSADQLLIKTTYLYSLDSIKWLGPFGQASLDTQVFHGYDIRTEPVTIVRSKRDGTTVTRDVPAQTRFALTGPFEPMFLRESGGVFAKPLAEKLITFKAKLGVGFQHVFVGDGYAATDNADTAPLEYTQLDDSTEAGTVLDLDLMGDVAENVSWTAGASFFYPFYTTSDGEMTGIETLNSDITAKLTVRLNKWASLEYVLSAKRIPLIIDEWQIQNGVMLTAGFDVI